MTTSSANVPIGLVARSIYECQIATFVSHDSFVALTNGDLRAGGYDRFILNTVSTHVNSPQLLAFLFATAAPDSAGNVRDNMLEELGVAKAGDVSHPDMLRDLLAGAGLTDHLDRCTERAEVSRRAEMLRPMLYGSLVELGLAALAEVTAFEYLLSQTADAIGTALQAHRRLDPAAVAWFTHHGVVDVAHAAAGLANLDRFVAYYAIDPQDAMTIVEMALRENVFVGRYLNGLDSFIDRSGDRVRASSVELAS